jgi:hypothetical protein
MWLFASSHSSASHHAEVPLSQRRPYPLSKARTVYSLCFYSSFSCSLSDTVSTLSGPVCFPALSRILIYRLLLLKEGLTSPSNSQGRVSFFTFSPLFSDLCKCTKLFCLQALPGNTYLEAIISASVFLNHAVLFPTRLHMETEGSSTLGSMRREKESTCVKVRDPNLEGALSQRGPDFASRSQNYVIVLDRAACLDSQELILPPFFFS